MRNGVTGITKSNAVFSNCKTRHVGFRKNRGCFLCFVALTGAFGRSCQHLAWGDARVGPCLARLCSGVSSKYRACCMGGIYYQYHPVVGAPPPPCRPAHAIPRTLTRPGAHAVAERRLNITLIVRKTPITRKLLYVNHLGLFLWRCH